MLKIDQDNAKTPFGQGNVSTATSIQFKGRPGALELMLDPDAGLMTILQELSVMVQTNRQLLGSTPIRLQFGKRQIDPLQVQEVRKILEANGLEIETLEVDAEGVQEYLEDKFGLEVKITGERGAPEAKPVAVKVPSDTPERHEVRGEETEHPTLPSFPSINPALETHAEGLPSPKAPPLPSLRRASTAVHSPRVSSHEELHQQNRSKYSSSGRVKLPELDTQPETEGTKTKRPGLEMPMHLGGSETRQLHKVVKTCRAGTFYDVEGDILVFGDVNPGAEIRATGDIVVFGALRGIAHAGSRGDRSAIITAFALNPTQLRLCDQIAIAPQADDRNKLQLKTEIAYISDTGKIEVESYQGTLPMFLQQRFSTF